MTVSTIDTTAGPYTGNGVATDFAYDWTVQNKSEVLVYETDDQGTTTVLTVDVDYTVNDVGVDGGGTITRLAGALPNGYEWYTISNFVPTQLTDFQSQGAFFPKVHEDALDKLTYLIQQLSEGLSRTIQTDVTGGGTSIVLPTPQALFLLGWNSDATALTNYAPSDAVIIVQASTPDETVYQLWYDTINDRLKYWDGTGWAVTEGANLFTELTDTPATITPNLFLRGNTLGTALEFAVPAGRINYGARKIDGQISESGASGGGGAYQDVVSLNFTTQSTGRILAIGGGAEFLCTDSAQSVFMRIQVTNLAETISYGSEVLERAANFSTIRGDPTYLVLSDEVPAGTYKVAVAIRTGSTSTSTFARIRDRWLIALEVGDGSFA